MLHKGFWRKGFLRDRPAPDHGGASGKSALPPDRGKRSSWLGRSADPGLSSLVPLVLDEWFCPLALFARDRRPATLWLCPGFRIAAGRGAAAAALKAGR